MWSMVLILSAFWLGLNIAVVLVRLSATAGRPCSAERDLIRFPPLSRYQASGENR